MIKDIRTQEVVEDYKLGDGDWYFGEYSKLLGNRVNKGKYKYTEDYKVYLKPYSNLFSANFPSSSFNNKKFSII